MTCHKTRPEVNMCVDGVGLVNECSSVHSVSLILLAQFAAFGYFRAQEVYSTLDSCSLDNDPYDMI